MTVGDRRLITLREYTPISLAREDLTEAQGELLWRTYGEIVGVEFPSPKTDRRWKLTSQGWAGHIPLSDELGLTLEPKVELGNLFTMLEYAYKLDFRILGGLVDCRSLQDFYERLANILARRVLDRGRKGFYRRYLPESTDLPFVRGRLDVVQASRQPWVVKLPCDYEDHTPDVEENQILAWTLSRIAASGMCSERVLPTVRRAYRALHGFVSVVPFRPVECVGRLYNRLNDDYHPLHALCRFFLEHSGPSHEVGDRRMLPFLVDMARLFELFVAEWLAAHLTPEVVLKVQEKVEVGERGALTFRIDLVLYDAGTGQVRAVLDTKYKVPDSPSADDVSQVVTYAEMKGCTRAILIYPTDLPRPFDERIGAIRIQSVTFALAGDVETAGQELLHSLGEVGIL
ncbi:MAG: restriction endonuclease [Candidatus Eisenbacteria bacterium]|nr:restriction endonuclease [Candidatus Eisenbacteria bacterium]